MSEMTAEQAATQIQQAYRTEMRQQGTTGEWVKVTSLMERLDLTVAQMTAGARHLARQGGWVIAPTSNQKTLTEADHRYALWIGGQWKHVICAN